MIGLLVTGARTGRQLHSSSAVHSLPAATVFITAPRSVQTDWVAAALFVSLALESYTVGTR